MGTEEKGYVPPTNLITSPQILTDSLANLGDVIKTGFRRTRYVTLFIKYTANDSTGIQLHVMGKKCNSSVLYNFPLEKVNPTFISLNPLVYTFTDEQDYTQIISIDTKGIIPELQVQVMADDVGLTPGIIETAFYTCAPGIELSAYGFCDDSGA